MPEAFGIKLKEEVKMTHLFKKYKKSLLADMSKKITGNKSLKDDYGKMPQMKKIKLKTN
jgi:hypothetical protein